MRRSALEVKELSKISAVSVLYFINKINKSLYDNDQESALKVIQDLTKQLSSAECHCERCNCNLTAMQYNVQGELCERCCDELAKQDGPIYTNETCPQCGSIYYEEQLGMCQKCFDYIQQGGLHE